MALIRTFEIGLQERNWPLPTKNKNIFLTLGWAFYHKPPRQYNKYIKLTSWENQSL